MVPDLIWSPINLVPNKSGPLEIWALHENQPIWRPIETTLFYTARHLCPPWSPSPPIQGATFWKSVPAPLLIYCDWFQTISRDASYVFDCGKNLGTHGAPPGGYLWKIPSGAPAYLLWHVGYQLYSDFSKKNESRVDATLFWMGLPRGPKNVLVHL